ncbi:hypothetical protein [Saccharothrix sp. Mg75]|uniref:hypothetical protein n=1 Tax=Saccharothrix sp. Mg75 TaxID=3445357 RepID=UPI003EEB725B
MDRTAVDRLYDCDVLDRHGRHIGHVVGLWLSNGRPTWACVRRTAGTAVVPIRGAQVRDRRLVIPVDRREVEDGPRVDDSALSDADVTRLHDHYGLSVPEQGLVPHDRAGASAPASPRARQATRPAR